MKPAQAERIKFLIAALKERGDIKNQNDLAEKVGIFNKAYMSHIVNGRASTTDFIRKVKLLYPDINEEWIKDGYGTMFNHQTGNGNNNQQGSNIYYNATATEQLDKALTEMAEQRKCYAIQMEKAQNQIDRLISIIEKSKHL